MRHKVKLSASCAIALAAISGVHAQSAEQSKTQQAAGKSVEEVTVTGLRQRLFEKGMLKDVIQKTEVISGDSIDQMQAVNLTEAISQATGVNVSNECSMCGVKRVMLNGLRGEQTTILVDGIPTYTMMSGFYGLDAAATASVERIEIARGAGASLIAPEAIGGTINLISKEVRENGAEIDFARGENGYEKRSLVATGVANEDTTRVLFAAQYDNRDDFDADNNGVSENPSLENTSFTLRLSQDIGDSDNLVVRLNRTESEVFGGPAGTNIGTVLPGFDGIDSPNLFVGDDVRNSYIGKPWETTEWIESTREEAMISWLHEFSDGLNLTLTASHTDHEQDSFYEGFIYNADNKMSYFDARFNFALNEDHHLTFGIDNRSEGLRSETGGVAPTVNFVSDSFDYDTVGLYIQDTWTASEDLQVSLAFRIDDIEADFVDPSKAGVEIDKTLVSPRLDLSYSHNDKFTSRFSAGRGYRAPLSFFETDHGLLEEPFDIEVDELERSVSTTYTLSYQHNRLSATGSLAYTEVENLALLGDSTINPGRASLQQAEKTASVLVADVALTYQLSNDLSVSFSYENFDWNNQFKQSYGVVPAEQRIVLSTDWEVNGFDVYVAADWVGSRDLSDFGTPENPTFDEAGNLPKSQNAESFVTVDFKVSKALGEQWQVYVGANNLFDYTQTEDQETPLFYEGGGYDVAHIYGPLRGREAYAGVKYNF